MWCLMKHPHSGPQKKEILSYLDAFKDELQSTHIQLSLSETKDANNRCDVEKDIA